MAAATQTAVAYGDMLTPLPQTTKSRAKKQFDIKKTFGFNPVKQVKDPSTGQIETVPGRKKIEGFAKPGRFTPEIDPDYVFPDMETMDMFLAIHCKDNVLAYGPTGCGKSTLVTQMAARLNYNVIRINFDDEILKSALVGQESISGKSIVYRHGLLPIGMSEPGTIILIDEFSSVNENTAFVFQRPLERNDRKLLILENGGEVIEMHPDNMFVATANDALQGDDTGLYSQGTRPLHYSQVNRFSLSLKMDYLPADEEQKILTNKFPTLSVGEAATFVKVTTLVRDGFTRGEFTHPLSTRDLINWCEKYALTGDPERAAKLAFLNRMPAIDAKAIEGLLQRNFQESA